jgi:uncharacterized protein (DUF2141 family)
MRATLTSLCLILATASAAAAQQPDTTLRAPGRTIIGVVLDTAGYVLDSAEVFVASLRRSTVADTAGRFRFTDVKPGEYQVASRRLGHYPQTRTVTVTKDSGGVARFVLVPYARGLDPVVSSARRGGLSGVVGDTGWAAIKSVEITEVTGLGRAVTDSMGAFFLDLRPGKHMIRVQREGFASQLLSVTIPKDSGRRMMVFLKPSTRGEAVREENAIFDMGMRLSRRSPVYSTFITREDINKGPWTELHQIAQSYASGTIHGDCLATIDGGPRQDYVWAIRASEIEAIEVYRARQARVEVRSVNPGGRLLNTRPITDPVGGEGCGGNAVYVWLRK